jgi:trimeric autotransporter adhesin
MQSTPTVWRTRLATAALAASVALMGTEGIAATGPTQSTAARSAPGIITTVAGTGRKGYTGNGKPASGARIAWPSSVATDVGGNVFLCEPDNCVIRRVDLVPGTMRLIAGSKQEGFAGDGGMATEARLSFPGSVFVDSRRHVWMSDSGNMRIRKVDASTGAIQTVAGKQGRGFTGDGGPATSALLDTPGAITVDAAGNLYFYDTNNHRIRSVKAATGVIDTLVGTGETGYNGEGGDARDTQIGHVGGLALDAAGNLYFSDASNSRIRRVDAETNVVTTVAGTGEPGFEGDGGPATEAQLQYPAGVVVDVDGSVIFADRYNNRIRRVDGDSGIITTVAGLGLPGYAGDGGPALHALLDKPNGVALDQAGVLYIADTSNHAIRAVPGIGAASREIQTPVITDATYEKPLLTITGSHLFAMPGVVVRINGRNVKPRVGLLDASQLRITVGPKQAHLVPGDNEVVVVVGGIESNTFVLRR